jgi:hypothetical protein
VFVRAQALRVRQTEGQAEAKEVVVEKKEQVVEKKEQVVEEKEQAVVETQTHVLNVEVRRRAGEVQRGKGWLTCEGGGTYRWPAADARGRLLGCSRRLRRMVRYLLLMFLAFNMFVGEG